MLLAGCGYIGEPLPPLANVPARVANLAAIQRGDRIIAQFSVPLVTTENKPIPPPATLDLRAGVAERFEENDWAAHARRIPPGPIANGIARYEIPASAWIGSSGVIIAVRVVGGNGKAGAWSNFAVVPMIAPPERPTTVTPVATAAGVRLTWQAKGAQFRVFRKPEGGADFALAATVDKPEWVDAAAEFGKRCEYVVQTVAKVADDKFAESEISDATGITPQDTFAPAAPSGLHATAGPATIELNWEPNAEPDLATYRVYRAAADGEFAKLADVPPVPSYSDKGAERGKLYRYAVTAIDQAGNESVRSAVSEARVE
jgi:hypothetical protein